VIIATSDPVTIQGVLATAAKRADEVAQKFQQEGGRGKSYVVTIAGARGGVGKSTIAINLAVAMAKQKTDLSLIDFSMSAGDFVAMLDDVPRNTLADAISQGTGLDAGYLKNILTDHSFGFRYLACPNQDFDYYSFDYDSAVNFITQLRTITEYAILDTGSFDLLSTIAAIENSDVCFLITSRDLARLFALQRFIKTLEQREISKDKLKIIINNAEVGTEISEKEIEDVLQHPVTAYLPSSPLPITFSINSGKPLLHTKPDLPFCAVISKLAEITKERWQDN
jgi:pilus assembly protein CpaE